MIDGSASEPGPKRLNFSDERPVMPGSTRDEPVCWAGSSVGLLGHTNPQKARLLDGQVRNMSSWIPQRGRRAANKLLCLTSLPLIFAAVDGLESELHGRRQPTLAETLNLATYNSL
jgi:hypothetical protein